MNEKYDIKGSWVSRNATPPKDGQSVTCTHCEQRYIFVKKKRSNRKRSFNGRSHSTTHENPTKMRNSSVESVAPELIEQGLDLMRCPYTVNGEHEPNLILKDNDLKYKLRLPISVSVALIRQLSIDAEFLYSLGVMDFSLLGKF